MKQLRLIYLRQFRPDTWLLAHVFAVFVVSGVLLSVPGVAEEQAFISASSEIENPSSDLNRESSTAVSKPSAETLGTTFLVDDTNQLQPLSDRSEEGSGDANRKEADNKRGPNRLKGPSAKDRQISRVVALLLRREHLLNDPLDDDHAGRGLENFLKALDWRKNYFYKSDVEEFRLQTNSLDDSLKRGDIRFAYFVFDRFLQRVEERVAWVDELLSLDHDFSITEYIAKDPDDAEYPVEVEEAYDRWRKTIKYDLLVLKADKVEGDEAKDRLRRRYDSFSKRMHQIDSDDLLEMYLTAMTMGFDPHTTFMSASTLDDFHIQMGLELEGIGAALQLLDGYTVVSEVIPGGAADKQGKLNPEEELKSQDRIVSVGQGADGEMVDVIDMKLRDVVKLIRGKKGTIVRLGIQPGGQGETKVYTITRAKIELKDKEARSVIFEDGQKTNGSPYRIGAIRLPSFYMDMSRGRDRLSFKSTTRDVRRILEEFKQQQVDAVVVDLRRNGGGSLTEAITLTGLFIDRGPVVQVKGSIGNRQVYNDREPGMAWDGPLVVLTSKFSASASEIFAGAIKDYRRGLVVGDSSTHGKGTVQSLQDLGPKMFPIPNPPNYGALKITMQQFYRPSGDSTQKHGVRSDVVLPQITDHFDIAESDLDYALDFHQVPPAQYEEYNMVDENMVAVLRTRSAERLAESEDFQKAIKKISRYLEHKKQKKLSINEEDFFARRAEVEAEEEEKKELNQQDDSEATVIERDYYFEEVLDITLDYVEQLKNLAVARLRTRSSQF